MMESLKFLEQRQLGYPCSSFTSPLKKSWNFRSKSLTPKHFGREMTELCAFDTSSIRVYADGTAFIETADRSQSKLEIVGELFVTLAVINGLALFVMRTANDRLIKLHVCEDIEVLQDAANCSQSIDLTKFSEPTLNAYQINVTELVCFDRSSGLLIAKQSEKVLVLDTVKGICLIQLKTPALCEVNFSSGNLCVWWSEEGSVMLRHITLATVRCTSLVIATEEPLVLCVPTAQSVLIKACSTSVMELSLEGVLSDLGSVVHLYTSEADGECYVVMRDGHIYSLNNPSLTYKLKSTRVKCHAEGPYLFIAGQQAVQVLCRSTMKEVSRVPYPEMSKARCISYNCEREELWISDSKGRVGVLE